MDNGIAQPGEWVVELTGIPLSPLGDTGGAPSIPRVDLEDDLDDSAVPETMKMFSIWLAKALAADFQTSDIGLGLRERTISPPVK